MIHSIRNFCLSICSIISQIYRRVLLDEKNEICEELVHACDERIQLCMEQSPLGNGLDGHRTEAMQGIEHRSSNGVEEQVRSAIAEFQKLNAIPVGLLKRRHLQRSWFESSFLPCLLSSELDGHSALINSLWEVGVINLYYFDFYFYLTGARLSASFVLAFQCSLFFLTHLFHIF